YFIRGGWKCVTLRKAGEDSWHFVSNLETEKPDLPTVYPAGGPWRVVSLSELTPYQPQEVETEPHYLDEQDDLAYGGGWALS
ncbi:MAG: hypothetical protein J6Z20_07945, partial [Bacteroidales bacterium]|nr:hypothetical protein [Bacteroidales bacterium]